MRFRTVLVALGMLAIAAFLHPPSTSARHDIVIAQALPVHPVPTIQLASTSHDAAPTTTATTTTAPAPTTTTTAPPPPPSTTTTEPPPDPPPPPAPSNSVEDAIAQAFGTGELYQEAMNVSWCESRHDPSVVSKGGENYGLFQINYVHADAFEAYTGQPYHDGALDPYANAAYARHLYDESGGWGPWACRWAAA